MFAVILEKISRCKYDRIWYNKRNSVYVTYKMYADVS